MRYPLRARGEIESFDKLILAGKQVYVDAGIDVHYETEVTAIDPADHAVTVTGEGTVRYDRLIICTGFDYADPGVPGGDLSGLYYVKNIRRAAEWDKVIANTKRAVVIEASPLALEMVTALAHRGGRHRQIYRDVRAGRAAAGRRLSAGARSGDRGQPGGAPASRPG